MYDHKSPMGNTTTTRLSMIMLTLFGEIPNKLVRCHLKVENINWFILLFFYQFYRQEPGREDEILNCLQYVRPGNGYIPKFDMFSKVEVNGEDAIPLYKWLKVFISWFE